MQSVQLYVSSYPQGQGLFPTDTIALTPQDNQVLPLGEGVPKGKGDINFARIVDGLDIKA